MLSCPARHTHLCICYLSFPAHGAPPLIVKMLWQHTRPSFKAEKGCEQYDFVPVHGGTDADAVTCSLRAPGNSASTVTCAGSLGGGCRHQTLLRDRQQSRDFLWDFEFKGISICLWFLLCSLRISNCFDKIGFFFESIILKQHHKNKIIIMETTAWYYEKYFS